jgi:2',3'-cyclic-nucleotide 2'-phosphodiesterase/3'-nucleotidase
VLAAGVLLLVLFVTPARAGEQTTLTVLFTSDMHAHVLPFDDIRERPSMGSIAQAATVIARIRSENPATVVLDGGDIIEGTPLNYYAIVAPGAPGDDPTIAAMNLIAYDGAVIGNHEFNFGLPVLVRSLKQATFPWLAANLEGGEQAGLPVRSEVMLAREGVRIGVLGLTNPNVPHWDPEPHWRGLKFDDPVAVARARIPKLRAQVDVLIVVVHSGFEREPATGTPNGSDEENFAWRLAQLEGIDLLLTGHTHRNLAPQRLGRTVIAQPGRWAEFVTRVDLALTRQGRRWQVTGWRGENIATMGAQADERVLASARGAHERAVAELSRPLGQLLTPVRVSSLPLGDDAAVDLIHAVQLEGSGAQLSLAAPLGVRVEFPAGPLTPRLAHALYPYPNTLVVVRLTGRELKDVLEHAVRGWLGLDCSPPPPCALLRDPSRPSYNFDSVAGATYLVDPTAPVGDRIRGLRVAGRPVTADESFTVVTNSYRASGGGGFPHLVEAPRVAVDDRPMVELLVDYFARHRSLTLVAADNWAFTVPLREMTAPAPAH